MHFLHHSSIGRHVGWFNLLAIVITAAVNKAVQASLQHDGLDPFQCVLRVVCLNHVVVLRLAS